MQPFSPKIRGDSRSENFSPSATMMFWGSGRQTVSAAAIITQTPFRGRDQTPKCPTTCRWALKKKEKSYRWKT